MSNLDFLVFTSILLFITFYGIYKNYQNRNLKSYFLGDKSLSWSTIGLSVMATQASAITFISTPGQGYSEGMSFVQNYLRLPLALIVVSVFFIPKYYGSNVYTAYQFLEERFEQTAIALPVDHGQRDARQGVGQTLALDPLPSHNYTYADQRQVERRVER